LFLSRNNGIPFNREKLINEIWGYDYFGDLRTVDTHIKQLRASIEFDSLSNIFTHDIVYIHEDSDSIIIGPDDGYLVVKRAQNLNEAFIKIAYELEHSPIAIEDRTDQNSLAMALVESLRHNGILMPIEFGVMSIDTITRFPIATSGFIADDIDMKYTVKIFPNELASESNFLVIQFPGRNMHLLKSMAWTLAGSLLLTLIILITFAITIFMILRQKKLSDIKSDFINNMTHEFKTPISTISLAVDSIDSPKIIDKEKEIRYYTNIIREENHRMNNHVESVLRMSLLDKHDLEFNLIEVDVHELIEKAISKIKLLLDERNGSIMVDVLAEDSVCMIDPDHFTNALLNLLDNAIKYSEDSPKIEIQTLDTKKGLSISITDHGMGMSKDIQHKIFDKFFRKSSGNIHNIKGFGLGLSYVKAVIDAMNGSITVKSELGKGSTFEIVLSTKY
jgi:two-component system phosphate regulon sensor histidine kinase PhoR